MTENLDPYENAIAGKVNGILNQEFFLETYQVEVDELEKTVKQSIEIYNSKRPHFSCDLLTPDQMHMQKKIVKPTYKKKYSSKEKLTAIINIFLYKSCQPMSGRDITYIIKDNIFAVS